MNINYIIGTRWRIILAVTTLAITHCYAQYSWINQSPAGITDDIWCVTYANETFVAVTGKGKLLTSVDGYTWSVQSLTQNVWLVSIAYGGGLWVAVGDNGTILYSADLKTWLNARAVTPIRLNGVAYTGSTFIAVGEQGVIATSSDAQNWTLQTSGVTTFLHGIAVIEGSELTPKTIFASGGANLLVSADEGKTWRASGGSYSSSLNSRVTTAAEVLTYRKGSANSPGKLVGSGSGGTIVSSVTYDFGSTGTSNGIPRNVQVGPFSRADLPQPGVYRGLADGIGVFVTTGDQGSIFTSPDGANWTQRFSGDSPSTLSKSLLLSVAFSEPLQRFVAVGTGGTVLVSNGAPNTLVNVATRGNTSPNSPLIGGFVLQGGGQRNILVRAVGPTLGAFGVEGALADPVLTIFDSTGRIVATNNNWSSNANLSALVAATLKGAFPLNANSKDAALYLTLPPGGYTATVTSASGATGAVLFEAYAP